MSEAASVPFSETKAPESADRLHRGALGLVDISASTMANIGPAYSFFFGIGFLVLTAGIAAPLTIIVAGIAIALLGNTLAQFSRAQPVDRRVHHLRRQDLRRHQRGDHGAAVRGRLHHRDLVGAGHLRRVPVDHAELLLRVEHPVGHPVGHPGRGRRGDDDPRRGRLDQAGRVVLRLRDAGAGRRLGRRADQERRPPELRAVRAQPHHQRLQRPGRRASRWRSTCSSAGRTRRRWPRRPATPGATCRGRCSCPSP